MNQKKNMKDIFYPVGVQSIHTPFQSVMDKDNIFFKNNVLSPSRKTAVLLKRAQSSEWNIPVSARKTHHGAAHGEGFFFLTRRPINNLSRGFEHWKYS